MKFSPWFEKHPAITLISLVVVLFTIIDLTLGLIFIPQDHNSFRTEHFYYHHGLLPDQKAIGSWSSILYRMYTNSVCCRDRAQRHISLTPYGRRILFIGDSHTEGVGLNYEETFAGLLQQRLDSSGIEILNTAVVSYSPKIYYLRTRYLLEVDGIKADEAFVFIDFSDLQNELVYESYIPKDPDWLQQFWFKTTSFLKKHSFVAHQMKKVLDGIELRAFLKRAQIFDSYRTTGIMHHDALELYAGFFSGFNDNILLSNPKFHGVGEWIYDDEFRKLAKKGLQLGQENILKLAELCRRHQIQLTLSVHPWQEQILRGDTTDMYVDSWRAFCEHNNIRFINLYPAFIHPRTSSIFGNDFFLPNDNHWNLLGNRIVADELMKYLGNNGRK